MHQSEPRALHLHFKGAVVHLMPDLPNAQSPMPNALCPMPDTQCLCPCPPPTAQRTLTFPRTWCSLLTLNKLEPAATLSMTKLSSSFSSSAWSSWSGSLLLVLGCSLARWLPTGSAAPSGPGALVTGAARPAVPPGGLHRVLREGSPPQCSPRHVRREYGKLSPWYALTFLFVNHLSTFCIQNGNQVNLIKFCWIVFYCSRCNQNMLTVR